MVLASSGESVSHLSHSCPSRHMWVGIHSSSIAWGLCGSISGEGGLPEDCALGGAGLAYLWGPSTMLEWATPWTWVGDGVRPAGGVPRPQEDKRRVTTKTEPGRKPQHVTPGRPCAWTDGSHVRLPPTSQLPRALIQAIISPTATTNSCVSDGKFLRKTANSIIEELRSQSIC